MASIRIQRFEKELTKIISNAINNRLQNKNLSWVTITAVKLTPDLAHAKIYFTHITEKSHRHVAKELNRSSGVIKNEIAKAKMMRIIPDLKFFYDDLGEKAEHLEDIFRKINAEKETEQKEDDDAAE